ncbi:unnamed protein product, partial [marine sediment metagenome]
MAAFAQERPPQSEPLLPSRASAPPWYRKFTYLTRWPADSTARRELKEIRDVRYSYETFIREVFRDTALKKGWEKNVPRVQSWVPKEVFGRPADAYLYRQTDKSGLLHVCDTRSILLVALVPTAETDLTARPRESLKGYTSKLFKFSLPEKFGLKGEF